MLYDWLRRFSPCYDCAGAVASHSHMKSALAPHPQDVNVVNCIFYTRGVPIGSTTLLECRVFSLV
jgi:hypothetical protein